MVTLGSEVLVCFVELGKDLTEKKIKNLYRR